MVNLALGLLAEDSIATTKIRYNGNVGEIAFQQANNQA
jgi:hypothetical protein